jgi:alpha-L-rhamnosidase
MRYGYDMNTAARTMQNALAVEDFSLTAQMAHVLGKSADATAENTRANELTQQIQARLRRPDGVFVDGLEANGAQSTHASQQANAWPLAMGIVPADDRKIVADYVVSLKNKMGVVYYRVLLDALHDSGRDQALVDTLTDPSRPGYANILKQGATFTWESWLGPHIDDSQSHGWGSTVLAVLQDDILGAHTTSPGSATVDVQVPETAVTNAQGVVATQRGAIPISWTFRRGSETIDITIPANMTAVVRLESPSAQAASEAGGPITGDAGVISAKQVGGFLAVTIGSGHYVFANTEATHGLTTPAVATGSSSSNTGLIVAIVPLVVVIVGGTVFLARRRRRRTA